MSGKHIDELLQQCLTAFDAGMEPEECLSAFPASRAELEPLFRQAVSLRVAFAASPSSEFRMRTRERVMFAAGRDVIGALSAEPDPEFVMDARMRFIRAAGLDTQESLRSVPPPRLPFWMNARRRLLETAAATAMTPPPPVQQRGYAFAMRAGLSAAVVVLAVAVAGLAYMTGVSNQPSGASAELAQLEHDLLEIEQQQLAGSPVSAAALQDLSTRTSKLLGQIEQDDAPPALVEKLPDLIDRQKTVVLAATIKGTIAPELAQAQTQQLAEAEKAVEDIKLAAAVAPTSTAQAVATATAEAATAASSATAETTSVPSATTTAVATTTPGPLEAGQVRVTSLTDDTFGNQAWKRVDTLNLSFSVPETWSLTAIELDDSGLGEFEGSQLLLQGPDGVGVIVNINTGQITASVGTSTLLVRGGGINGKLIAIEELAAWTTPALVGEIRHVLESVDLNGALETPTPAPTSTATPPASPTALPSSTPEPSATP